MAIILDINGDEYKLTRNQERLKAELFSRYRDSDIVIIMEKGVILDKLRLDELFNKIRKDEKNL
jgi:hypothetical protein